MPYADPEMRRQAARDSRERCRARDPEGFAAGKRAAAARYLAKNPDKSAKYYALNKHKEI